MQPALARRGHMLLALKQDLGLLCNLVQPTKHYLVAIIKTVDGIRDLRLLAKFLDKRLDLAQVMSRYAGEEVVHRLEL